MDRTSWISRVPPSSPGAADNRSRVVRMNIGAGTGAHCAYCHKQIQPDAVEYEVDVYVAAGLRTKHFHRVCLHLWEALH